MTCCLITIRGWKKAIITSFSVHCITSLFYNSATSVLSLSPSIDRSSIKETVYPISTVALGPCNYIHTHEKMTRDSKER